MPIIFRGILNGRNWDWRDPLIMRSAEKKKFDCRDEAK